VHLLLLLQMVLVLLLHHLLMMMMLLLLLMLHGHRGVGMHVGRPAGRPDHPTDAAWVGHLLHVDGPPLVAGARHGAYGGRGAGVALLLRVADGVLDDPLAGGGGDDGAPSLLLAHQLHRALGAELNRHSLQAREINVFLHPKKSYLYESIAKLS